YAKLAIAIVLVALDSPALAQTENQDAAQQNVQSRYSFNRVNDGLMRLDNRSGLIAFCSPNSVGWSCQAVPEDRAALEKEIARLQDEVASLKQEMATLRPSRPPADLNRPGDPSGDAKKLREDLERARVAVENA